MLRGKKCTLLMRGEEQRPLSRRSFWPRITPDT